MTGLGEAVEAFRTEKMPWLHAVLVARGGGVVLERYWGGKERDLVLGPSARDVFERSQPYVAASNAAEVHNIKSVSKSVLSMLAGIANAHDGFDVDAPLASYLPSSFEGVDEAKHAITIRHLLTMRSGLQWDENGPITYEWIAARDRVTFALHQQELVAEPGARLRYSTSDTHLLAAALTAVVGDLFAYASRTLFGPLGFGPCRWTSTPEGIRVGGSEIFLTLPDLAKVARLVLDEGRAPDGTQVVPQAWMAETTARQPGVGVQEIIDAYPPPAQRFPPGARRWPESYGHLWWHTTFDGVPGVYGHGYGGQLAVAIPALDTVVAEFSSTAVEPADITYERSARGFELIEQIIVPALR